MSLNRRHFLLGASTLLAAPAIVKVSAIMPVKALPVAEAPLFGVTIYGRDVFGYEISEFIPNVRPFEPFFGKKVFNEITAYRYSSRILPAEGPSAVCFAS